MSQDNITTNQADSQYKTAALRLMDLISNKKACERKPDGTWSATDDALDMLAGMISYADAEILSEQDQVSQQRLKKQVIDKIADIISDLHLQTADRVNMVDLALECKTLSKSKTKLNQAINAAERKRDAELRNDAVSKGQIMPGMEQSQIARALESAMRVRFGYDYAAQNWYAKNGDTWVACPEHQPESTVIDAMEKGLIEGFSASMQAGVFTLLRKKLIIDKWEASKHLIPMTNGVLNLQTRTLEPYGDRRFNWQLPHAYAHGATCPAVDAFLDYAAEGDNSVKALLMAWLWAVFHGRGDLQKYLEIIGKGGSGKSTLMQLCIALVGEQNVHSSNFQALEEDRFETANLYGKRLIVLPDQENWAGRVGRLKQITGGDPLRNEKKNIQAAQTFVYTGTVIVTANDVIQSKDYSSGITRRRIGIRFEKLATPEMVNKYRPMGGIIEVMRGEIPGLINQLIAMDEQEAIKAITQLSGKAETMRVQNELNANPVLGWLDEYCVICPPYSQQESPLGVPRDAPENADELYLYASFEAHCLRNGHKPVNRNRFAASIIDHLGRLGHDAKLLKRHRNPKQHGRWQFDAISGLRLLTPLEMESDAPITRIFTGNEVLDQIVDEESIPF